MCTIIISLKANHLRYYTGDEYGIKAHDMATVTYGTIKEFDPTAETISAYLERLQLYFEANAKKVSVLLMVIGPKVYTLLRGLLAPTLPKEKGYKELEKVLKEHYEPKPLVIAERFHFYKRGQAAGVSCRLPG